MAYGEPQSGLYSMADSFLSGTSLEFLPEFVEPYKEVCPLCSQPLLEPYQTQCGHRLCRKCLENHLNKHGDPAMCPFNEEDCEEISLQLQNGSVYPDYFLQKNLKCKKVYCKFRHLGCQEIVRLKNLQRHLGVCEYGREPCPYSRLGCTVTCSPSELNDHITQCQYKPLTCVHCGQAEVATCLMEEHLQECPMVTIPCVHGCGAETLRGEFQSHLESCPNKPSVCKYSGKGCTFQGSATQVKEHEDQGASYHLELVENYVAVLEKRVTDLEGKQELSRGSHNASGEQMEAVLKVHNQKLGRQETMMKKTQKMVIQQEEKLRETTATLTDAANSVRALEQARSTTHDLEEQIKAHTKIFKDLNLRFQILETASYNGTLIWKIKDYNMRKADTKRKGGVQSLYSQAFYTSRHGYRMCARVYLNGDGVGAGTHLSLFFVVMRGEYDQLLKWPFRQKVSLMLMDQTGKGRHIQDTFKPDPSSSSFQKPRTDMNIASGCPLFISHEVLEAEGSPFLVDQTLFIKVAVDTSDLLNV